MEYITDHNVKVRPELLFKIAHLAYISRTDGELSDLQDIVEPMGFEVYLMYRHDDPEIEVMFRDNMNVEHTYHYTGYDEHNYMC